MPVVLLPQNGSRIQSFSFVEARMILARSGSGTSRASKAAAETMKKKLRTMFIAQGGQPPCAIKLFVHKIFSHCFVRRN